VTQMEKRNLTRFELELPARLTLIKHPDPTALELITSDVCAGGAYFQTDRPLPVGTELNVEIVLPLDELKKIEGKKAHIKVSGSVIRINEQGMAIRFEPDFVIQPLAEK